MPRKSLYDVKARGDGKFDIHLIASNGEDLMNGSQGYDEHDVERALSDIRRAAMGAGVRYPKGWKKKTTKAKEK